MFSAGTFYAALAMTMFLLVTPSHAKSFRLIDEGSCSGSSTYKLKLSEENNGIEVEWEVDSNVNGQQWNYVIKRNGSKVAGGKATTQPPSGSWDVNKVISNLGGVDDVVEAFAKYKPTGETCSTTLTWTK